MRLPLHAIHPLAEGVARTPTLTYVQAALNGPLWTRTEVTDVIGLPCAYDVTIEDGAWLALAMYVAVRATLRAVADR